MSLSRHPHPFLVWFVGAMAEIRLIWPWTSFILFTPAEIIIGFSRIPRPPPANNDNRRQP